MYGQLRVPKQYFSLTDDSTGFNGGTSLTIISSRYAKMINRIQNTLIQAITDAINLMLLDKGLDNYINEFTIHMLPPTTQEEIDRRDNINGKIQLTSDIMNMLAEIEDPAAKLKILKALLGNVIDDNEVLEVIQEQIDKLEEEGNIEETEEPVDDIPIDDMDTDFNPGMSSSGFNNDLLNDQPDDAGETESEDSGEETILPTPDELGVDMSEPQD